MAAWRLIRALGHDLGASARSALLVVCNRASSLSGTGRERTIRSHTAAAASGCSRHKRFQRATTSGPRPSVSPHGGRCLMPSKASPQPRRLLLEAVVHMDDAGPTQDPLPLEFAVYE